MAFLFGRNKEKRNDDLCKTTKDQLVKIGAEDPAPPKLLEDLSRSLGQMKLILQGTPERETDHAQVRQLVEHLIEHDVLLPLAKTIHILPFEARKDTQTIFSNVFRYRVDPESDPLVLDHVVNRRPEIIVALCRGYDRRESAMPCGGILREAIKTDTITALILYDEPAPDGRKTGFLNVDPNRPSSGRGVFWDFFDWIDKSAFEVSADAFNTFRDILTKNKKIVAHYLRVNYDLFVQRYNTTLIQSPSYVTKRQSIKLFSELLLERSNYEVMTSYIQSAANLKIAMNLLRDERRMLNYEAFHIFKIFVANPDKSDEVRRILVMNRDRLLKFLPAFLSDREDDLQFKDEKAYCIRMIEGLPAGPSPAGRPPGSGSGSGSSQGSSQAPPGVAT